MHRGCHHAAVSHALRGAGREEAEEGLRCRRPRAAIMASDRQSRAPPDPGGKALHPQRGDRVHPAARLDLNCARSGPLEVTVPAPPQRDPAPH